ncbi:MAG TPA: DUF2975 domain-containing protein [Xanthomonadales bacterium]|nr:DUF2975 domain-containing protein [Xanthomonadales bacterium]
MPQPQPGALGVSRVLLKIARAFNLLVAVMLIVALPASFVFEPAFFEFFSKRPARIDPSWLMPTLRIWLVLAFAMVAAVHVVISRLLAMVETVRAGDPFVPENAVRLNTIAWCGLGLQVLHLVFGLMAATVNAAGSNVDWQFSWNGWIAVALVFVLARVFEEGTRMRADLGTMI